MNEGGGLNEGGGGGREKVLETKKVFGSSAFILVSFLYWWRVKGSAGQTAVTCVLYLLGLIKRIDFSSEIRKKFPLTSNDVSISIFILVFRSFGKIP